MLLCVVYVDDLFNGSELLNAKRLWEIFLEMNTAFILILWAKPTTLHDTMFRIVRSDGCR